MCVEVHMRTYMYFELWPLCLKIATSSLWSIETHTCWSLEALVAGGHWGLSPVWSAPAVPFSWHLTQSTSCGRAAALHCEGPGSAPEESPNMAGDWVLLFVFILWVWSCLWTHKSIGSCVVLTTADLGYLMFMWFPLCWLEGSTALVNLFPHFHCVQIQRLD